MEDKVYDILGGIEYGSHDSKMSCLNQLGDLVEFKQLSIEDLEECATKLIDIVLYETNPQLIREIFRAIENIFLANSSINVSLESLIDLFDEDETILANTLTLIPFICQKKYIALVKTYLNHNNVLVSKNAAYALKYLDK
jgi:hypothetical protein